MTLQSSLPALASGHIRDRHQTDMETVLAAASHNAVGLPAESPGQTTASQQPPEPKALSTRVEIIPSEGIVDAVCRALPASSTITVTCLPHHGLARTMATAVELAGLGYTVIPHIAATALSDRSHLLGILRRCQTSGITDIFAIGGDAAQSAGPYASALPLMEDISQFTNGGMALGIAGYPEGHPSVGGIDLLDALLAKQHLATHVVTQMCFSAPKILEYAALLRREGVELPVWAGIAGAVPKARLVSLATKIGVGTSLKFLSRKGPLARRLLAGGRYSPDVLVSELAEHPGQVSGFHLYSFNNLLSAPDVPDGLQVPTCTDPISLQGANRDN